MSLCTFSIHWGRLQRYWKSDHPAVLTGTGMKILVYRERRQMDVKIEEERQEKGV